MSTETPKDMHTELRLKAGAVGFAITAASVIVAYFLDRRVAAGVAIGGLAGIAGFWMLAGRVAQLSGLSKAQAATEMYRSMAMRVVLYGVALTAAYQLDKQGHRALIAAAFAIVVMRTLLVLVGVAGIVRRTRRQQP